MLICRYRGTKGFFVLMQDIYDTCEENESEISHYGQLQTEDAETQMDQWTPVMDSIKKEAGETVLAHMEERLASSPLPRCD